MRLIISVSMNFFTSIYIYIQYHHVRSIYTYTKLYTKYSISFDMSVKFTRNYECFYRWFRFFWFLWISEALEIIRFTRCWKYILIPFYLFQFWSSRRASRVFFVIIVVFSSACMLDSIKIVLLFGNIQNH